MVVSDLEQNKDSMLENLIQINQELILNLSNLIIPFSKFFKKQDSSDVYTGKESIPFNEKDTEFKSILIQEFI
jgi:hypothetical protein